jgi:hypothetical protein
LYFIPKVSIAQKMSKVIKEIIKPKFNTDLLQYTAKDCSKIYLEIDYTSLDFFKDHPELYKLPFAYVKILVDPNVEYNHSSNVFELFLKNSKCKHAYIFFEGEMECNIDLFNSVLCDICLVLKKNATRIHRIVMILDRYFWDDDGIEYMYYAYDKPGFYDHYEHEEYGEYTTYRISVKRIFKEEDFEIDGFEYTALFFDGKTELKNDIQRLKKLK